MALSRHEGVSCDSCLINNFRGRRYKCLRCYDYDLCGSCFDSGATNTRHNKDHPMQCIVARGDYAIYYGGENVDSPQSFTCPYCARLGFTETTLFDHVNTNHLGSSYDVLCPVCATTPGAEPNYMTADLGRHLGLQHHSFASRELASFMEDPFSNRRYGPRRSQQNAGGTRGSTPLRQRHNMHFSMFGGGGSSSSSSSMRNEAIIDPIADLLSHLSGVRRSTLASAAVANNPTLQQLQIQLQLDRQQHISAATVRQQIQRYSRGGGGGASSAPAFSLRHDPMAAPQPIIINSSAIGLPPTLVPVSSSVMPLAAAAASTASTATSNSTANGNATVAAAVAAAAAVTAANHNSTNSTGANTTVNNNSNTSNTTVPNPVRTNYKFLLPALFDEFEQMRLQSASDLVQKARFVQLLVYSAIILPLRNIDDIDVGESHCEPAKQSQPVIVPPPVVVKQQQVVVLQSAADGITRYDPDKYEVYVPRNEDQCDSLMAGADDEVNAIVAGCSNMALLSDGLAGGTGTDDTGTGASGTDTSETLPNCNPILREKMKWCLEKARRRECLTPADDSFDEDDDDDDDVDDDNNEEEDENDDDNDEHVVDQNA